MLPPHSITPLSSTTPTYSLSAFNLAGSGYSSTDQGKLGRHAGDGFAIVEEAVQRVYDFARISAQQLSTICGREADYYLRLIFQRGEVLHPPPEQEPPLSCQFTHCESTLCSWIAIPHISRTDNFIENLSDSVHRQAEFQEKMQLLSPPQQQLLRGFVQGGCYSSLSLSRAKPSERAQNVNDLLTMIKGLVSCEHSI